MSMVSLYQVEEDITVFGNSREEEVRNNLNYSVRKDD